MQPQRMPVWLEAGDPLPDPRNWASETSVHADRDTAGSLDTGDAPQWPAGLIAAGDDLSAERLLEAYRLGIFPWYSEGQPVLWWSTDPRMVLETADFKMHRSLRKTLRAWHRDGTHEITMNKAFDAVIRCCAEPRDKDVGTWITRAVQQAYGELHRVGHAQSVEVWRIDRNQPQAAALVGGLYGVSIGRMFFGESMFALETDTSKAALAALVTRLLPLGFAMIDCQQNTRHLASLGAAEIPRDKFLARLHALASAPPPDWSAMSTERIEFPLA